MLLPRSVASQRGGKGLHQQLQDLLCTFHLPIFAQWQGLGVQLGHLREGLGQTPLPLAPTVLSPSPGCASHHHGVCTDTVTRGECILL